MILLQHVTSSIEEVLHLVWFSFILDSYKSSFEELVSICIFKIVFSQFSFFIFYYSLFFYYYYFFKFTGNKKKKYSNEEAIYKIGRRVILKSHKITKRLPNWHSKTFYSIIGDRSVTQTIDLLVTNTYSMLVEKFLLLAMETYEFISKLMCFPNNFIRTQYF